MLLEEMNHLCCITPCGLGLVSCTSMSSGFRSLFNKKNRKNKMTLKLDKSVKITKENLIFTIW